MKNSLFYIFVIITMFVSVLLFSAKKLPTKGELRREKLEERLRKFRSKRLALCTNKVMERAGELADSTLIARAKLQVQEVIEKPEIPYRPDRPEIKLPKDTTPVVPIFPDGEVLLDTISEAEQ
ncbi:MAG: hypothetical protein AB8F74_03310 [Saprospiraceae bacterium]